jgi:hypothetical protein
LNSKIVLQYFVQTEHGDVITKKGVAIPMLGVIPDYYSFSLNLNKNNPILKGPDILIRSDGWIFNCISSTLKIVGIGYFSDISLINATNSLTFGLENGWHKIEITGGVMNDKYLFELNTEWVQNEPEFKGNVTFEYVLE